MKVRELIYLRAQKNTRKGCVLVLKEKTTSLKLRSLRSFGYTILTAIPLYRSRL